MPLLGGCQRRVVMRFTASIVRDLELIGQDVSGCGVQASRVDSARALSYASPGDPIDAAMPSSARASANDTLMSLGTGIAVMDQSIPG